jgi:ATP synthase protein I
MPDDHDKDELERPRERLDELGDKLSQAKRARRSLDQRGGRSGAIGTAFRLSTELVAGLVVGVALGWFLDESLGTSPWFLILFFFLGMAAGIINVVRTAQRMNAEFTGEQPPPSVPEDDD